MSKEIIKQNRYIPTLEQTIEICNQYGIGDLISIIGEIENTANVNIRILTKTGNYVIRIFTGAPERLAFIIDTLILLNQNNIPALLPLKNIYGEYFSQIGSHMLQITKYEYGYPFICSKLQVQSSGRILRKLHDCLFHIQNEIKPAASTYPSTDILRNGIVCLQNMKSRISTNQIPLILRLYDEIVEKWEATSTDLPKTIIHGDWHPRNQLYGRYGEVTCIMDFDFMRSAERIFDIAYALWYLQLQNASMDIARYFMAGYGPLFYKEIQLLPLEIARISYFFVCTSSLSLNPERDLNLQVNQQLPIIKWALSKDGSDSIKDVCIKK